MSMIHVNTFGFITSSIGMTIIMLGVYHQSYLIAAIGCLVVTLRKD